MFPYGIILPIMLRAAYDPCSSALLKCSILTLSPVYQYGNEVISPAANMSLSSVCKKGSQRTAPWLSSLIEGVVVKN